MEILTPVEQNSEPSPMKLPDGDIIGNNMNLKNLEFLNYLGMKDEMFKGQVMEKIDYLAKNIPDLMELQHIDWKVGGDNSMSRVDRIFSYLKLDLESREMERNLNLINEAKQRYAR